jgi:hypothetical protein
MTTRAFRPVILSLSLYPAIASTQTEQVDVTGEVRKAQIARRSVVPA